jgi:hypothetical protein
VGAQLWDQGLPTEEGRGLILASSVLAIVGGLVATSIQNLIYNI